jgi:hypothetical protein
MGHTFDRTSIERSNQEGCNGACITSDTRKKYLSKTFITTPSRGMQGNTNIKIFLKLRETKDVELVNPLKPTGHVMHQQINIQQLHALPTLYLCVLYLSENKQRLLSLTAYSFYNRDEKCLLRGTNWVFK